MYPLDDTPCQDLVSYAASRHHVAEHDVPCGKMLLPFAGKLMAVAVALFVFITGWLGNGSLSMLQLQGGGPGLLHMDIVKARSLGEKAAVSETFLSSPQDLNLLKPVLATWSHPIFDLTNNSTRITLGLVRKLFEKASKVQSRDKHETTAKGR